MFGEGRERPRQERVTLVRSTKLVSIVVPAFNREETLERTVRSVLSQTHQDTELLIVDDRSTDSTADVARQFERRECNVRALVNQRKKGAPGARNTGLLAARGTWTVFLDSDDCLAPTMIERLLRHASGSPNVDVVTCHTRLLKTERDREIACGEFSWTPSGEITGQLLTGETYVDMNAAMMRTEHVRQIGGLDENCPSFQEWDFHIRLSRLCRYSFVPEKLVDYYQHGGQMSKNQWLSVEGLVYVLNKHKRAWIETAGRRAWYRRCVAAEQQVNALPWNRSALYKQLIQTEPLTLVFMAANVARRMVRPIKNAAKVG